MPSESRWMRRIWGPVRTATGYDRTVGHGWISSWCRAEEPDRDSGSLFTTLQRSTNPEAALHADRLATISAKADYFAPLLRDLTFLIQTDLIAYARLRYVIVNDASNQIHVYREASSRNRVQRLTFLSPTRLPDTSLPYNRKWWHRQTYDRSVPIPHRSGVLERLLLDSAGWIIESDTANVLIQRRNDWLIPAHPAQLQGTRLSSLLRLFKCECRMVHYDELQNTQVFLANAGSSLRLAQLITSPEKTSQQSPS